jgi:predicted nucleic acid-binding protein
MGSHASKVSYFDASALVKLVADDADEVPGRAAVRAYYYSHGNLMATPYCVTEALSAFKMKFHRRQISRDEYKTYVKKFVHSILGGNLRIEEPQFAEWNHLPPILSTLKLLHEAEKLLDKYDLDFIDCVQIVTILHGKEGVFRGPSQPILITADRDLAKAACAEGAKAWDCTSEAPPP